MGVFERPALVLQSAGKDLLRVCQQVARLWSWKWQSDDQVEYFSRFATTRSRWVSELHTSVWWQQGAYFFISASPTVQLERVRDSAKSRASTFRTSPEESRSSVAIVVARIAQDNDGRLIVDVIHAAAFEVHEHLPIVGRTIAVVAHCFCHRILKGTSLKNIGDLSEI